MPLQIVDADAMTQGRRIVDTTHAVEFPDKKVAFSIETNAVRAMERIALPLRSGTIGAAQGHQELAIQRELLHRVYAIIHAVHHIVRTNMDAMRPGAEHALTPGAQEAALTVKDDHRVLATIEDVDIVLGVH